MYIPFVCEHVKLSIQLAHCDGLRVENIGVSVLKWKASWWGLTLQSTHSILQHFITLPKKIGYYYDSQNIPQTWPQISFLLPFLGDSSFPFFFKGKTILHRRSTTFNIKSDALSPLFDSKKFNLHKVLPNYSFLYFFIARFHQLWQLKLLSHG